MKPFLRPLVLATAVPADSSGNGRTGTLVNGAAPRGAAGVALDGTDDYVKLPDNLLAGLNSITVSTEVLVNANQGTPYFIWGLGNTTSGAGNGYLYATGNSYKASIATGNWTTEQTVNSGANLARSVWKTLTYTLDAASDTARLYLDGTQVAQQTGVTITPASIASSGTRCIAGKIVVTATATNPKAFAAKIVIGTTWGSKSFADVAPGATVSAAFTTRAISVTDGSATATATAFVGGKPATASASAPYSAASCN